MKRTISLLLVLCVLLSLVACVQVQPNPSDTDPGATETMPTNPGTTEITPTNPGTTETTPTNPGTTETMPTNPGTTETTPADPAPTEAPSRYNDRISVEAEQPTDKYVDVTDRVDMGGNPMYQPGDQPHSARKLAEDGLQYVIRSTTCIIFCAYDWYTYTFEVETAGTYVFGVLGSCDRDTPVVVYVDGAEVAAGTGIFNEDVEGNGTDNYARYDDSALVTLELSAGTHTIKVAIEELKNHNFWVDCYWLKPTETGSKPTNPPAATDKIRIEAEKPASKSVDTKNYPDLGGGIDHTYRAALLGADGLHYANNEKTAIVFSAFDTYTYTFEAAQAGKYVLYILGSCDRDTPVEYTVNSITGTGYFESNNYQYYSQVKLGVVDVAKGTNTLKVTIKDQKNHNINTDCYILIPGDEEQTGSTGDWADVIDSAMAAEKITEQTENPVWKKLYVSTKGKDTNDGSKSAPFATLKAANEAVKTLRNQMQGDIVIYVDSGIYFIDKPLVIGVDGGGANGYRVIYRGDSDDKPIISGGVQITGWTKDGNIWSAPCDVEDTRTFYVNDNMAVRARSKWLYSFSESYVSGKMGNKSDGLIIKSRNFTALSNYDDIELVFDSEWMHHRYPVANIIYGSGQVTFEMQQPYWNALFTINGSVSNLPNVGKGFYVENALELLDEPGEFYFDKDAKRIYYYPFDNEDMKKAKCYVGVTEGLLQITGNDKNARVDGLTFENIQFKYGAWNEVSTTGLVTNQADDLRIPSNPLYNMMMPAQVRVEYAKNITFRGCVFACLGSTALGMPNAVSDCLIDGNVFKDISGIAISVGCGSHDNKMPANMARPDRIDITNNVIRRIGAEFRSAPAVMAYYVSNTRIMHNDIADVPYSGIDLGWGWGQDVKACQNNVIAYNKIENAVSPTHDGAHIYILGPNYNTYINNNWCINSGDMRGGIYPDEGAAHLNIFHNVVEKMHTYWLFARPGVKIRNINVFENYSDTPAALYDTNNVVMDGNLAVTNGQWPEEAVKIMEAAGVSAQYKDLLKGVELPSWHTNFVKVVPNKY